MTDLVHVPIFEDTVADVARRVVADRRGAVHRDGDLTEILAALNNLPRSGGQRRRVFEEIAAAGMEGRTDFELELALAEPVTETAGNGELVIVVGGMRRPTPGNRRGELEADGLGDRNGDTRPTNTGSPAVVFRITDRGLAALAELRRLHL